MSKEIITNVLEELIDSVKEIAIATLKENGNSSEDCQLYGLIIVAGIEHADIRVFSKSDLFDKDLEQGYPFENLVMDISVLLEMAESMVNKSLYARTDLADMARNVKAA
jgi:hypothetical protein